MIFLNLDLELREQRLSVRGGPGEARKDLTVRKTSQLLGSMLDDRVTQGHLSVGSECGLVVPPNGEYGRSVSHGQSILNASG